MIQPKGRLCPNPGQKGHHHVSDSMQGVVVPEGGCSNMELNAGSITSSDCGWPYRLCNTNIAKERKRHAACS